MLGRLLIPTAVAAVTALAAFAVWTLRSQEGGCADLGPVQTYPVGTVIRVDCVPAFVVNNGDDITVFLAETPHLRDEPLTWNEPDRVFYSSFHGETFDSAGQVLSGPAWRPLWRCPTEVRGDRLWIATDDLPGSLAELCKGDDGPTPPPDYYEP